MDNKVSVNRGTLGVSTFTDGERCHVCRVEPGFVRLNIDGIWHVLGAVCVLALQEFIAHPTDVDPRAAQKAAAQRAYEERGREWD